MLGLFWTELTKTKEKNDPPMLVRNQVYANTWIPSQRKFGTSKDESGTCQQEPTGISTSQHQSIRPRNYHVVL